MSFERPDGLVKRNRAAASGVAEVNREVYESNDEDDKKIRDDNSLDDEVEDEDMGDKHTRLNLMEQVLLMGIKDREVSSPILLFPYRAKMSVHTLLMIMRSNDRDEL